jgi:coniferyl-aldehyde dehydrogenase
MTPSTSFDSGLATILAVQRKAFLAEGAPTAEERRADLTTLHGLLIDNRKAIAQAVREDFGARSRHETEIAEIATTLHTVRFARRNLGKWMKPRRRKTGIWFLPAANRIIPQPKGCIGIMVPFNFPINLAVGPLTSALAAGNRAMLKMSELTPHIGELFARSSTSGSRPRRSPSSTAGSRCRRSSPPCPSTICSSPAPPRWAATSCGRRPRT